MHQPRAVAPLLAILLLLVVADASAQDKSKTGITMGYPASVGVVVHISDRFAIRPELHLSVGTGEGISTSSNSETSTAGVGFSALFYLRPTEKLRPYVAPQYGFVRSHNTAETALSGSESTSTSHAFGGFFGAQYSLHDRFSLFGEVGVIHTFGSSSTRFQAPPGIAALRSARRVTSTRTGVGVIFYF